jgi:hypothetical protein
MRNLALTVSAMLLALSALPASAQPFPRTWVSGIGNDSNLCTRNAPCKTFAGAIANTAANGIIDCLDPGGFGAVTITKSVTIDCEETIGSVLVSGTNGINISTAGVVVNLRGLNFEGLGGGGLSGLSISQPATVYVRKSVIYGFANNGISVTGGTTLVVSNSVIHSNSSGIAASGGSGGVNMILRDVVIHDNTSNAISIANTGSVMIDRSTLADNGGAGLLVNASSLTAMVGNSTITGNATGVSMPAGTLYSFKNNHIGGNASDGTPITAFPGPGGPLQ